MQNYTRYPQARNRSSAKNAVPLSLPKLGKGTGMQEEKRNKRRNNHNNAPQRTTKEQEATQYRPRTRRKEATQPNTFSHRNNDATPNYPPRHTAPSEQSGSYRPRTLKKRDTTPQHTEQSQHNDEYTPPAHSNRKAKPSRTPFNKRTPTENLLPRPTKKSTKNKRSSNTTYEQGYSRPTRHRAPFQREDKHPARQSQRRKNQETYAPAPTQHNTTETNQRTEPRRSKRLGSASPFANHQRQENPRQNEYFRGIDKNSSRRPQRHAPTSSQQRSKRIQNDEFDPKNTTHTPLDLTQPMRLNRFIAHCGQCSRREADEMITRGEISINGTVTTTLGEKIIPDTDIVTRNGEQLKLEQKVYILLNKPKDCFCTVEDEHATRTVLDLVAGACSERIYPVGRLDRNTTGLLLLTNDGELTEKLTHPSYAKQKTYEVTLDRKVTPQDMEQLYQGVTLDDGEFVQVDEIAYVRPGENTTVGVTIHTGQNRVVRRMFDSLGFRVEKLDRVIYAGLTKRNLPRGKWRFLTDDEIRMLRNDSYR